MTYLRSFWFNLPIGHKGAAVAFVPIVCLAGVLLWIGVQLDQEKAAELQVNHAQRIRAEAQRLLGALTDAETGVRGYDLTLDRAYLDPYQHGLSVIPGSFERLNELTADDEQQRLRALEIEKLARKRLSLLEQNLNEMATSGDPDPVEAAAARQRLLNVLGRGKLAMDAFRRKMDGFIIAQDRIVNGHIHDLRQRSKATQLVVWGAAALGIAGGVLASCLFSLGIARRLLALEGNADRVSRGEALLPHHTGTDEISRLDQALHGMAAAITDRETALKQEQQRLRETREAALAASRAKSDFLAGMSHEIRTPMNAIIGMSELLAGTPLSDEQQEYVRIFQRAGNTLLVLINDVLDLSKIEAGHLQLEEVAFDPCEIAEQTTDILALRAQEKGVELLCDIHPNVPARLLGDPDRLRQVLVNLLGNAVKFTAIGEVVLRVERCPSEPDGNCLLFSVSDTGVGIPEDKLDAIFERFTQADSSTTRQYGGTGLGLTISKRLVELMGGRIWVESRPGHGSTFSFTACFGQAGEVTGQEAAPAADLQGLNALIVDDNSTNRLILRQTLSAWGAEVAEAEDGTGALTALQAACGSGRPYQLLLVDCRMPTFDGFQLAEAVRADAAVAAPAILMLTSDNRFGDLARARELGLAGCFTRPVKRAALRRAILDAVSDSPVVAPAVSALPAAPSEAADAADEKRLRILLVDDSSDNCALVRAYVKKLPYELDVAENGQIAVAKFTTGCYDLVLMDMQMPVMDGYTATRQIRNWERVHRPYSTPIIALTAHALAEDARKSLDAGCTAHVTKPVKKGVLLQTIETYTRRVEDEPDVS